MHAFDVLGDPVRRRILELLADGELSSGAITATVQAEFGISQPAVSQHLKVLRESGFATVRPEGTRRLYAVDSAPLQEVDGGSTGSASFWEQRLDSLATELARGKRERRLAPTSRRPRHQDTQGGPIRWSTSNVRSKRPSERSAPAGSPPARDTWSVSRRTYDAPIEDVWDAVTNPERISRWFLPVSGDLRAGRALPAGGQRRWRDPHLRTAAAASG